MAYQPSISSRRNEKWLTLISMHQIIHKGQLLLAKFYYNVPVKLKLQHPPLLPSRAFEFLENFCANPPFLSQKAVQMPHRRSISGDQMPPLQENSQIPLFFI